MPTVRFALNNKYYNQLENDAKNANMNIQDYIRYKLFNTTTIFTPEEAIKRIIKGNFDNREFTLPDVFGEEWTITKTSGAGALGKAFFTYISEHPELGIQFVPNKLINRRTVYKYNRR